jgi:hypothetical protein
MRAKNYQAGEGDFLDGLGIAARRIRHCCLCNRTATFLGIFIPHHPEEFSLTPLQPGKERIFFYGLCGGCRSSWPPGELARQVEEKMAKNRASVLD